MQTFTHMASVEFTTDDRRVINATLSMVDDDPHTVTVEIREGIAGVRCDWREVMDVDERRTPLTIEQGFVIPAEVMSGLRAWLSYYGYNRDAFPSAEEVAAAAAIVAG